MSREPANIDALAGGLNPAAAPAPALVRGVAILDALALRADEGATLAEIVRATRLSKSSVHNLLVTLLALEMVTRAEDGRRYRLGPALIPLGAVAARGARPLELASEAARALAAELGLSLAIFRPTEDGRAAQVVASATPGRGMHVGVTIGDRFGVVDGAVGKSLLSALNPVDRAAALDESPPIRRTPRTTTDPTALLDEAAAVEGRGWASSAGEFNENNAVSALVWGPEHRAILGMVALGFPSQLPEEELEAVGERVLATAQDVTIRCGGAAPRGGLR